MQELEEKVLAFVRKELGKISRILNSHLSECVDSQPVEEENALEAKESAVKITIHILKSMKEHSLVHRLLQC